MPIRFACPSCRQPIEVDDEWADQEVGCPYCRRVVSAPAQSTLDLSQVRTASAGSESGESVGAPPQARPFEPAPTPRPPGRRPLGRYAFLASSAGLVLMLIWFYSFNSVLMKHTHPDEWKNWNEKDVAAKQRQLLDLFKKHSAEFQSYSFYPILGCMSAILGVILGIVCIVRDETGRGAAILAVILGVMAVPCTCLGVVFSVSVGSL